MSNSLTQPLLSPVTSTLPSGLNATTLTPWPLAPRPKSGAVRFRGTDLVTRHGAGLLQARRHLQMVFQDPFGSLDPKWRVRDLVAEPLVAYRIGTRDTRRRRVDEAQVLAHFPLADVARTTARSEERIGETKR
jgi:ABC-type microcin C transport system duplicated ATPase subunit YejF